MEHCRAEASRLIDAAPETLWSTIAQVTDMEVWYPALISSSNVDTTTEVPTRHCVMRDGGELYERILLRDDTTRTFIYAIDCHPMPAVGVVGTIRIDPAVGGSHVTWDAQFTTEPEAAAQMTEMVSGMYRAGLDSLANHHQN